MRRLWVAAVVLLVGTGCVTQKAAKKDELKFEPVTITADMELSNMNDNELFAAGTSAYAAEDWRNAARYFGRIADFFPKSPHRSLALYNAGLADERMKQYEDALQRFHELSDPATGKGDALNAAFKEAEALYFLDRHDDAANILKTIAARFDISMNEWMEAEVQEGICEYESALASNGNLDIAESTLRKAMTKWQSLTDPDEVDDEYPAQAEFFIGEIYRTHYESVTLDPDKTSDELSKDLEYKAELLLSAQGHFLRAIRLGNGVHAGKWAIAAGGQIGGLYENLYDHMANSPAPKELNPEEAEVYRQELRKKIRILITKAITIYENTLDAAERIGERNTFVDQTRERLQRMKDLLLAEAQAEDHDAADSADDEKKDEAPEKTPPPAPAKKGHKKPQS